MQFLSPNSPLGRWLAFLLDALLISVAWFLCSVPIVTLGASTAALNRVAQNWMRTRSDCSLKYFFQAFRENFKGGTLIWLILLVPMYVIGLNAYVVFGTEIDATNLAKWMIVISGGLWIATAVYAFALQAAFENGPVRTVLNALRLAIFNLARTAILVALFALAMYCAYRFPFAAFLYTPFCVFLAARPIWGVFRKVMDLQDIPENTEDEGE